MGHANQIVFVERRVVGEHRVGRHGLVEAYVGGTLGVDDVGVGLQLHVEAVGQGGVDAHVGVAYKAFAQVVVAVEGIERVGELDACGVQRRVPYLEYLGTGRLVVEIEHLAAQHRVGHLLGILDAFGNGRCVARRGVAVVVEDGVCVSVVGKVALGLSKVGREKEDEEERR